MSEDEGKENQSVEDQEEEAVDAPFEEETTETNMAESEGEGEEQTHGPQAPEETLLLPRDTLLSWNESAYEWCCSC